MGPPCDRVIHHRERLDLTASLIRAIGLSGWCVREHQVGRFWSSSELSCLHRRGPPTSKRKSSPSSREAAIPATTPRCATPTWSLVASARTRALIVADHKTWRNIIEEPQNDRFSQPLGREPRDGHGLPRGRTAFERAEAAAPPDPGSGSTRGVRQTASATSGRGPPRLVPQDDTGYGFDDDGNVLLALARADGEVRDAAERVARAALRGPNTPAPVVAAAIDPGEDRAEPGPSEHDQTGSPCAMRVHAPPIFGVIVGARRLRALELVLRRSGGGITALDPEGMGSFHYDRQALRASSSSSARYRRDHRLAGTIVRIYEGLPASQTEPVAAPASTAARVRPRRTRPREDGERRQEFEKRLAEKVPVNNVRATRLEVLGPSAGARAVRQKLRKVYACGHVQGGHGRHCAKRFLPPSHAAYRRPVHACDLGPSTS